MPRVPSAPVRMGLPQRQPTHSEHMEPEPELQQQPSPGPQPRHPSTPTTQTARPSYIAKSFDLATEYVDDESKDGCTDCPPTCKASKTFCAHVLRAVFPFFFLAELIFRWCMRKRVNAKNRQAGREETGKWKPKQKLVTVRRVAECAGWFFRFLLVYVVMCNSGHIHATAKSLFAVTGVMESAWWTLFLGNDPWEVNLPSYRDNHNVTGVFVDVALSETYFPIFAFLLLVVLYAHEETSYPRRKRIEYSVETDAWLLRGVEMVRGLAVREPGSRAATTGTGCTGWWQKIAPKGEHNFFLVGTGTFICFMLGLQPLIVYFLQLGLNNAGGNGFNFDWLCATIHDGDVVNQCDKFGGGAPIVPMVGVLLILIGMVIMWLHEKKLLAPALARSQRGVSTRPTGSSTPVALNTPLLETESDAEMQDDAELLSNNAPMSGEFDRWNKLHSQTKVWRVHGFVTGWLFVQLGMEAIFLSTTRMTDGTGTQDSPGWNRGLTAFGLVVPTVSIILFFSGGLILSVCVADAARELDGPSASRQEGDRVEIGQGLHSGRVGTVVAVHKRDGVPVNQDGCKVQLDPRSTIEELVSREGSASGQSSITEWFPLTHITKVSFATGLVDNYTKVTVNELRKLSFDAEKYSERYSRRFRELQCTPIEEYHFATFNDTFLTSSLQEKLVDLAIQHVDEQARRSLSESANGPADGYHVWSREAVESRGKDGNYFMDERVWEDYDEAACLKLDAKFDQYTQHHRDDCAQDFSTDFQVDLGDWVVNFVKTAEAAASDDKLRHIVGFQRRKDDSSKRRRVRRKPGQSSAPLFRNSVQIRITAKLTELPYDKRKEELLRADHHQLMQFVRAVKPAECERACNQDTGKPDPKQEVGPFFEFFSGSLVFKGGSQLKNTVIGALMGVIAGVLFGYSMAGTVAAVIFAMLGFVFGVCLGRRAVVDPSAGPLVRHILDLHRTMQEEVDSSKENVQERAQMLEDRYLQEWHDRNPTNPTARAIPEHDKAEIRSKAKKDAFEDGCTLFADRVGKMILYLSKARQFKRRHQWGRRLWWLSLLHAAIPFLYTFAVTAPWAAGFAVILIVLALLVSTLRLEKGKVEDSEQDHAATDEQTEACSRPKLSIQEFVKLFVLTGLGGTLLLWLAYGIYYGGSKREYDNVTDDKVNTDICGAILDTQGQCCFDYSPKLATIVQGQDQSSRQWCCPSEFFQSSNQLNGSNWGGALLEQSDVLQCDDVHKKECSDIFQPTDRSVIVPKLCIGQSWLDNYDNRERLYNIAELGTEDTALNTVRNDYDRRLLQDTDPAIGVWCSNVQRASVMNNSLGTDTARYYVSLEEGNRSATTGADSMSLSIQACELPFRLEWITALLVRNHPTGYGCFACGGNFWTHTLNFLANAILTYAIVSRLYRCYEDYFIQYHRILYFIQLTPWSTMKHLRKKANMAHVEMKHEHWGLLPTFDLDTPGNIAAWNKLRLFLQTYELRSSRRLQVSVVYLLLAWVATCVYQAIKFWVRKGDVEVDIETFFVLSTTAMLAYGLSAILFTGKWINDVAQIGFPHVLRVKQAELLEKSSHYLVEHDFWNGSFLHRDDRGPKEKQGFPTHSRKCEHHHCTPHSTPLGHDSEYSRYSKADRAMFQAIELKISKTGIVSENTLEDESEAQQSPSLDLEAPHSDGPNGCNCMTCHARRAKKWLVDRRAEIVDDTNYRLTMRCYHLLDTLIHTVHDEYRSGSRSHWGAEDRRTKLWFIMMSRGTINAFAAALLSGLGPVLLHWVWS